MAKKKEEIKNKKKGKKGLIICSVIVLVLVIAALIWYFTRTFDVTFKYNNGLEDYKVSVRFNNLIKEEDVKRDLTNEGMYFVDYYETYLIETEEDKTCKEGFKLEEETKCISEKAYDFKNQKITKDTIIEAIWSKEEVKEEPAIVAPKVDNTDYGTISVNSSSSCFIANNSVTINATVSNAKDSTVNWNTPSCYSLEGSATSKELKRTCENSVSNDAVITARLNNGKTASVTVTYEPTLSVTVKDGNTVIYANGEGDYKGGHVTITTNVPASFSGQNFESTTSNSVTIDSSADSIVTITTKCGQSTVVSVVADIA